MRAAQGLPARSEGGLKGGRALLGLRLRGDDGGVDSALRSELVERLGPRLRGDDGGMGVAGAPVLLRLLDPRLRGDDEVEQYARLRGDDEGGLGPRLREHYRGERVPRP